MTLVTIYCIIGLKVYIHMPSVKSAYPKISFLFLNRNIHCGYSKEPSECEGSFEHQNIC